MARRQPEPELPPCYAMVHSGLEELAGEEITRTLGGEIKKSGQGVVVFRLPEIDRSILHLRTTEDVYLLAWGTDQLSYRAEDLDKIRRWTARDVNWDRLLKIHHAIRPKPKGKPSYRLVVQMIGEHGYRRIDARDALARGLAGKLPASWRPAEENASVEIWLTIQGATAVCGLRLSDRTMRHRTYKFEHLPASLRPSLAGAMVQVTELRPEMVVVDPMCGAGTILAEVWNVARDFKVRSEARTEPFSILTVLGGDLEWDSVRAAGVNLRKLGQTHLARWDAQTLPLDDASVDRVLTNLPFGKQIGELEEMGPLYRQALPEFDRILRSRGRAVLLAADPGLVKDVARNLPWKLLRTVRVRILGQRATILSYRKD